MSRPDVTLIATRPMAPGAAAAVGAAFEAADLALEVVERGADRAWGAADVCLVVDAPDDSIAAELPRLVRPILDDDADVVVASGTSGGSALRRIGGALRRVLAIGLTRARAPGVRALALRRTLAEQIEPDCPRGALLLEVAVKSAWARIVERPLAGVAPASPPAESAWMAGWAGLRHLSRLYRFKFTKLWEFSVFCLIGFSGMAVDLAFVTAAKLLFGLDVRICAIVGFAAAATWNHALNRRFTFPDAKRVPYLRSLAIFLGVCSVGLLVRVGVIHLLVVTGAFGQERYLASNAIGIIVAAVFNFVGSKFLAFSPESLAFSRPAERPAAPPPDEAP